MMSADTQNSCGPAPMEVAISSAQPLSPINEHEQTSVLGENSSQDRHADSRILHKDWDLTFRVKSDLGDIEYKVIEVNVSSASDAFNRLLYKTNSRPKEGAWEIELTDNPAALAVLLQIIHYQFSRVPKNPTIDQLFDICTLVSKYECTHLVQPWAEKWGALLTGFANHADAPFKNHKALWVAWVLGCAAPFREMVDSLILTSKADNNGILIHVGGRKLMDLVLPQALLDGIIATRSQTLGAILDTISQPMAKLSGLGSPPAVSYCKVGTDATRCEMMMFASVLPTLAPAGLFPIAKEAMYCGSITELKKLIYSIKYEAWEGKTFAPHLAHTNCNLGFKDAMTTILSGMISPVQSMHLSHLAKQAEVTGIDNGNALVGLRSKLNASASEFKPAGPSDGDHLSTTTKTEYGIEESLANTDGETDVEKLDKNVCFHESDKAAHAVEEAAGEESRP